MRLEAAYYLTQAFALKVGYTGMYVGNISVRRRPCDTTCRTWATAIPATQNLISNGVDFGIEFVY